ncbi:MAG TPA: hypothetical protein VGW36_03725 [Pyrinomonadaceae bacterium]|nr:hypothetical protein [Pyrinomonadaceae bacterium]
MKRIILVVLLVGIAGVAGIVRSYSRSGGQWPAVLHQDKPSAGEVREEIRKNYQLSPGARVDVSGINGAVKIETSDTQTADVYIERLGASQEALNRRKIVIESTPDKLTIRGEKGDRGFLTRMFGSNPTERVTLRLPRQIALKTSGVNGAVNVGEIDGPVDVSGINGKVSIAQATGSAEFSGINGSVSVALKELGKGGIKISGINGNIELRLGETVNADLDASGMNGSVTSDLPNVSIDKTSHGNYNARIGNGGNSISASGINGNIRITRLSALGDKLAQR